MTYEIDLLIASSFLVPVVLFATLDIVLLRTGGWERMLKPVTGAVLPFANAAHVGADAANDHAVRKAA
jgi:hypothetical protein